MTAFTLAGCTGFCSTDKFSEDSCVNLQNGSFFLPMGCIVLGQSDAQSDVVMRIEPIKRSDDPAAGQPRELITAREKSHVPSQDQAARQRGSLSGAPDTFVRQLPQKTEIGVCHSNTKCDGYGKGVAGTLTGSSNLPSGGCQSFKSAYDGVKWCSGVGERANFSYVPGRALC